MVLAQPRSRTKWLSEYLSYDGIRCGHDLALGCTSVDEFLEQLGYYDGTVETSAAIGYKLWRKYFPTAAFLVVHRTVIGVAESFIRKNLRPDWQFLYLQELMLDKFIHENRIPFFTFESLDKESYRRALCRAVGQRFDPWHDDRMDRKIEIDTADRLRQLEQSQASYTEFCDSVAREVVYLENSQSV